MTEGAPPRHVLQPRLGFDWMLVSWGGPDETRTLTCSYCEQPLRDEEMPLVAWNEQGWCAEFCEACQRTWWGFEVLPNDEGDDYRDGDLPDWLPPGEAGSGPP